jgi:tetratricopeptide (TPR) repeat protein
MKLAGNMLQVELEINIAQARQWLEQGELSKAVTAYTRLIGSHPNVLSINLGLGIALTFSQRFTEAEMVLQQALSQWPNQPDLLFSLADLAQQQGNVGQAEQLYRNGLAHHPHHLPCRQNLASLLYQTWRFTESARLHAETINLYPGHPASWRDLGQALVAAGHAEEGFNILTEACQRFPDDRETRFAFGLVALRKEE